MPATRTTGVELIAAERQRQIEVEGWTPEHDDEHSSGELAAAAVCYAAYAWGEPIYRKACHSGAISFCDPWPWDSSWDKRDVYCAVDPDDEGIMPTENQIADHKLRCLVKAGALIAAEIDRLQRQAQE